MSKIDKFKSITKDKFFTISFVKKNGEERIINGRLGVGKYVKGTDPEKTMKRNNTLNDNDMIGVFENNNKQYRTINLNTMKWLKVNGKTYTLDDINQ